MASTPMIDRVLDGRYQITEVLAKGGFGQTYLAMDKRRPGQPICVVKQLRSVENLELLPTIQRLFKTEAAILEKLGQHDCIPRLLAYFEENKEFYLVQEFIPGHSLDKELLPKRPLPADQVINLLSEVLEILTFVHSKGVIHRDIKPDNIIRRQPDQKLVLIDFGTVKEIRTVASPDEPKLTVAVGTPTYMPVEQFHGYPQLNSDIYALGIIGIQAISGLPIEEIRTLITRNCPPSALGHWSRFLSNTVKDVATGDAGAKQMPQLVAVLDKMVQLDYRERYQSVDSALKALQAICSSPTVPTSFPKAVPSFISPLSSELPSQIPEQIPEQIPDLLSTDSNVVTTGSKHRKLPRAFMGGGLAIVLIAGAYNLFMPLSQLSQSPPPATSAVPAAPSQLAPLTQSNTLSGHTDAVWSVALSADGQTLVSGSQDDTIRVWNPTSGELRRTIVANAGSVRSVSISADGQTLATGNGDRTVKVWDASSGQLQSTLSGHSGSVWSVALSQNGQTLVSGSDDGTVNVWNLRTNQLVHTLKGHSSAVFSTVISPYEGTVVSASADKTIKIWDLQTGALLQTLEGHGDVVRSLAMSPDGQTLASASWDRTIKIWNLQSGELLKTLEGHRDRVVSVAFGAAGKTLVSGSLDATIKTWNPQTGEMLQTLTGHTDWVLSVVSSARQNLLISSSKDKTIKIWQ